jgi:hypothetical protein
MIKYNPRIITQSFITAVVISITLPPVWIFLTTEIRISPEITTAYRDSMSEDEAHEWFEKNAKPAPVVYRIKNIPGFINDHWVGFLEAVASIFILVFLMNYFVLIFLHAKP